MSEVAVLSARITADLSDFERGMSKAARDFAALGQRMAAIGQRMTIGITAPLLAIGAASTKVAADFEALEIGMEAVTGSAAEAATQIERLREVAKLPAVDLEQATQASLAFQAIGKDAEFAERMIKGVANAVALSGGGAENFSGVIRQMRQVAGLGRLMGEEMNIIVENAPVMAKAIQQAFGTSSTEAIQKMGLTTDEFFERMMLALETLPRVAGGAKNTFENFGQAIRQAAETIGDQLLPVIEPVTLAISEWLEDLRNINPEILRWGIAIGAVAAAIGPLLIGLGALTTALGWLAAAIGASLLPLIAVGGPIILALGALSALFIKNKLDAAALRAEIDRVAASLKDLSKEEIIAETLGVEQRIAQLRILQAELTADAEAQRAAWEKTPLGSALKQSAAPHVGVDKETRDQLQQVNDELEIMEARSRMLTDHFAKLSNTPPVPTIPPLPVPDMTDAEADKYIGTLTEAVRLGTASAEQAAELRRISRDLVRAAEDANRPLERRNELLLLGRDAMQATVEAQRRHLLMTAEQSARLRLGQGGTVTADNLPTAEGEAAALAESMQRLSGEALAAVQNMAAGISASFANILTGTRSIVDGFRDMVNGILREVARLVIEKPIANFLVDLAGSFGGSIGGGGTTPNPVSPPALGLVHAPGPTMILHQTVNVSAQSLDPHTHMQLLREQKGTIASLTAEAVMESDAFASVFRGR